MTTATTWQNRIVGHGLEKPDELLANPRNWRIHPKAQQDALGGLLDKVGWVQDVIVNQRTGHVVDGHLRVSLSISRQEPEIPVVYVDLSPEEEALVLASLDPLAAMAVTCGPAPRPPMGSGVGSSVRRRQTPVERVDYSQRKRSRWLWRSFPRGAGLQVLRGCGVMAKRKPAPSCCTLKAWWPMLCQSAPCALIKGGAQ
jgi:hypothetical protein